MTDAESSALVAALVAAFPDAVVGPETLQLYGRFMRDVPLDIGAGAVATWVARYKKFPTIADLRELVALSMPGAPPDADRAWAEVIAAVKRGRQPTRWSHTAIAEAVQSVGFREIGQSETLGVERAHFGKAYEAARKRALDASSRELVRAVLPEMRELAQLPARAPDPALSAPVRGAPALPGSRRKR